MRYLWDLDLYEAEQAYADSVSGVTVNEMIQWLKAYGPTDRHELYNAFGLTYKDGWSTICPAVRDGRLQWYSKTHVGIASDAVRDSNEKQLSLILKAQHLSPNGDLANRCTKEWNENKKLSDELYWSLRNLLDFYESFEFSLTIDNPQPEMISLFP